MRAFFVAALVLTAASSPSIASAQENDPSAPAPVFKNRAIYLGVGAGVLPHAAAGTENYRVTALLPFTDWLGAEIFPFGAHFIGTGVHGPEDAYALGIGLGLRVAPFPRARFRPYVAARFEHVHFWPDPWGDMSTNAAGQMDMSSHHRWGGEGALGFDTALSSRFRLGLELQSMILSGPGEADLAFTGMGSIGFAL